MGNVCTRGSLARGEKHHALRRRGRAGVNLDQLAPLGDKFTAALSAVGLEVVRPIRKAGNLVGHESVDGGAIIVRLMGMGGWTVREIGAIDAPVPSGRAGPASVLRLVRGSRPEAVERPDVHAGSHDSQDNGADHRPITESSP
jgi:hypothetical protein